MLGGQIAVEMVFSGVFFPDIVVLTGLVFTGYRLRQLDAARRRFVPVEGLSALGRAAVRLSLSLGLAFWSANLTFLVFVALPRVVRFGEGPSWGVEAGAVPRLERGGGAAAALSPLHGLARGRIMPLTVTGRRSGRSFTVPVSYLRHEGPSSASRAGDGASGGRTSGEARR